VDRELVALGSRQDDHLEEVARAIRPDDEPTVGIFAGIFDDQSMIDGVEDILVDAVLSRRVRGPPRDSVYYEKRPRAATRVCPRHWASQVEGHPPPTPSKTLAVQEPSYTQMLWMGVKREAAYSPGF
jgi:hypothetical protein